MVDLARSPRRLKPYRFTKPLRRRPRTELPFVPSPPVPGGELLLDTCVYIDVLRGDTSPDVDALLRGRTLNHLAVCVAELTHAFGRLDPRHPETDATLARIEQIVAAIPPHRLKAPSGDVIIDAGILAGLVSRLGNHHAGREVAALNDAIVYLHAMAHGLSVLTRDVGDFDVMHQIVPEGRILFYERVN